MRSRLPIGAMSRSASVPRRAGRHMRAAVGTALVVFLAMAAGDARAQAPPDTVRVVVPTEGGVLYYRAGPGRGVVFRRPDSVAVAQAEAKTAQAVLDAVIEAQAVLAGDSVAVARLVRVEQAARESRDRTRRRAETLEREQALAQRPPGDPAVRPADPVRPTPDPARLGPEAERPVPVVIPVPIPPSAEPVVQPPPPAIPPPAIPPPAIPPPAIPPPPPVRVDDPPDPAVVVLPPVVTVEEVERAFLDTGLFRASRVPFAFGEATLLPEARRVLDAVGAALVRAPTLRVTVDGHTDAVSSDAFNLRLSQRRAASVREYLLGRFQIAPERLVARGFGEREPIATNETETGRALNRRVEFVVIGGTPLVPVE
ncbi:MAG: OmpA family protein [Bacteroidota bacterium]